MMRKILLTSVAVIATSASAFAADLPSRRQAPPPYLPPPPIFTWTGIYVGGQIGYEFGRDNAFAPNVFGSATSSSPNGVVGGAHIGYNYQINQFVVGIEGDVNGSSYSGNSSTAFFANTVSTKTPIDGSVRGRVGVAFDRALFYATGGAAFADIKDSYTGPFGSSQISNGRVGWTVGGGVEYAITNNWSVRGEYRYTDYGRMTDTPILANVTTHHQTDNRVQIGFSYKFDTFAPPAPVLAKY
jgi:outer membrane immunogenic protein